MIMLLMYISASSVSKLCRIRHLCSSSNSGYAFRLSLNFAMKLKTSVDLSFPENGRFIDRISLEALANSDAIFGVGVGELVSNGLLLSSLGGSERLKNWGNCGSSSSVALVRERVLLVLVLSETGSVSLFSSFIFSDIEAVCAVGCGEYALSFAVCSFVDVLLF